MKLLADGQQLQAALDRLTEAVRAAFSPASAAPAIIGIRTRGEPLARRLANRLSAMGLPRPDLGFLDITLYRDDLAGRGGRTQVGRTDIGFDLDGRAVLLVDDVLFTGRSVRAAMDALVDFGRPRCIRLAVLVDRVGRELPIQADFVGLRADADPGETVQVRLIETDDRDEIVVTTGPLRGPA